PRKSGTLLAEFPGRITVNGVKRHVREKLMNARYLTATLLALAVLNGGHVAVAQTTQPTPGVPSTPGTSDTPATTKTPINSDSELDADDRSFLENAAQSGHLEVQGSKLALEKSGNAEVKNFA